MRKRTVKTVADTVFWYALYFLPVLCYLLYLIAEPASGGTVVNFSEWFSLADFYTPGIICDCLESIFLLGRFDLSLTTGAIYFFSWYVSVYLAHLMIDFLLFIPRLAHKWMNSLTGGDSNV